MAVPYPEAFDFIGSWGSAEIFPEKILGSDEWKKVIANDVYLRAWLNRRRPIDFADLDNPIALEIGSLATTRFFEIGRTRFRLSNGRIGAYFDYDHSGAEVRVAHLHTSQLTAALGVIAGGAGYTNGDVLTIKGGTGTPGTVTVTGVSGGVITSVNPVMTTAGTYTAFPRSAVVGHGPETIEDGGTGYTGGDTLTVVGGTGTAATFLVNTVGGAGDVTSFSSHTGGDYSLGPFDLVSVTGGTGTGCRLRLDYGDSATRWCTVTGGTGTGAIINVSRRLVTSLTASTLAPRVQGTLGWLTLTATEYDIVVEARNTLSPGNMNLYSLRYREKEILADGL